MTPSESVPCNCGDLLQFFSKVSEDLCSGQSMWPVAGQSFGSLCGMKDMRETGFFRFKQHDY